jgi:hypothetical protein
VRCSLLFLDGERTLWAEKADYPVGNTYIVRETGRSFVEWEIPGKGEVRVYSKKGKRLFDHAGRLWAVSGSGRFMVCRFPGEGTGPECPWDAIVGVDDKDIQKVDIGEGFEVEAVAEDGKSYLVSEKEGDEAFHEYYLRDIRGRVLWEKSGPCHFLGLEGPWALWAKNNGKTVAYSDFRTGESKMEIPVWKYLQLHQHFYGTCFKL